MFDKIQTILMMVPDDENEHFKQPHIAIEQPFIMRSKYCLLSKVCTVTIKIANHQLWKMNWVHDINIFLNIIKRLRASFQA